MTTITDIRNELIAVFNGLRAGTIDAKDAAEVNNTAGKIIGTAKVQLAYHALRGESPIIPFLAAPVENRPMVQSGSSHDRILSPVRQVDAAGAH